jgi:methionyl-tRNA formyltransferase
MPDVLLIGLGPTAFSALQSLVSCCRVVGVVRPAQPDDPVAALAAEHRVPVFGDASVEAVDDLVKRLAPRCVVVSSYDRILPTWVLTRCLFINVHYSPLPQYRGRANVNWAILNGEPHTAISVHALESDLDAGRLLYQELLPIGPHDTVADLYERLNAIQGRELGPAVVRHLAGDPGRAQDGTPTYGCTRLPRDGEIDWRQPTAAIYALVRALDKPFPGAFTHIHGRRMVIWRAMPVDDAPRYAGRVPGRVVGLSRTKGHVDVLTGDGVLRLLVVQRDDETPCAPATLIKSVKLTLGLTTLDLLSRIETLEAELAALEALVRRSQAAQETSMPPMPIATERRQAR